MLNFQRVGVQVSGSLRSFRKGAGSMFPQLYVPILVGIECCGNIELSERRHVPKRKRRSDILMLNFQRVGMQVSDLVTAKLPEGSKLYVPTALCSHSGGNRELWEHRAVRT